MLDPTLDGLLSRSVMELVLATALGLFVGLEREWAQKSAGVRTFALTALAGVIFASLAQPLLVALGAAMVLVQAVLLGVRGLQSATGAAEGGLSLTTSASLLVTYGIGVLIARGFLLEGVAVGVVSALLLVLRRELHQFAWRLSREEVKSGAEFAILAFVVYPVLPAEPVGPWGAVDPRTVWLLVIAVSAIGFLNYVLMQKYGSLGLAVTCFFGGLVNSTAVIGEIVDRAGRNEGLLSLAVGAVLLADAAMSLRNLIILGLFLTDEIVRIGLPLLAITVVGVGLAYLASDWDVDLEVDVTSPFSLRNAVKFGLTFLVILLVASYARNAFGSTGFLVTSFLGGLVSSGSTTTTVVSLYSAGEIGRTVAAGGVLAGTVASILVKVVFVATVDLDVSRSVLRTSSALLAAGLGAGVAVVAA